MGFLDFLYKPTTNAAAKLVQEPQSAQDQRAQLQQQGQASAGFANTSEGNLQSLGIEAYEQRKALQRRALGQDSLSAEQLRQGLQQGLAGQRSMAAGASPANAAMAARGAAMNMGRLSSGLSGQTAMAGIAERAAAEKQLSDMIMGQRQQELQGALSGRQNAMGAYNGMTPEKSTLEKYAPYIQAGTSAAGMAMSDRRLKTEIKDGDAKAAKILDGLKAHSYKYKSEKHGKGEQFGPMAQDMERAGLGHAVIDTPEGKAVHGAKAALSSLALSAALARRVSKLEKGRK